jgi:spoIIIJ-associated protein
MEWKEFTAKTVNEALTNALIEFETTSDKVEYEIIERESSKLLGLLSKPAKIRVRLKMTYEDIAVDFLNKVFAAMNMSVTIEVSYDEAEHYMPIELSGDEMGILIGKRGITLDSLQYLVSLVVNRNSENYIKVKLDTENYRERRRETLENLARNLAHKVKRIHKPVYLEPMNPYERRVIHSTLQKDKFVETHSEGEEPYRKVVITLKAGVDHGYERRGKYSRNGRSSYGRSNNYRRNYNNDSFHKEDAEESSEESNL